jgi:hypothetical protein
MIAMLSYKDENTHNKAWLVVCSEDGAEQGWTFQWNWGTCHT